MKYSTFIALVGLAQPITTRPSIDHIFYEQPSDWLEKVDKKVTAAVLTGLDKEQIYRDHERALLNEDIKVIKDHVAEIDAADKMAKEIVAKMNGAVTAAVMPKKEEIGGLAVGKCYQFQS